MFDLNKSFKLAIDGLKDPETQKTIKEALAKIPGISDLSFDTKDGTAEGKLSSLINVDKIVAALDKLGIKSEKV